MGAPRAGEHTRLMRARDTSSPGAWRALAGWLRRREPGGGPALLYVTGIVTTCVVLAITLLAVVDRTWMVAVAFIVLVLSVAALMGVIGALLADGDDS
jgi:Na+/melibiose symporter-like transporter